MGHGYETYSVGNIVNNYKKNRKRNVLLLIYARTLFLDIKKGVTLKVFPQ